jgi:hypothetical protein
MDAPRSIAALTVAKDEFATAGGSSVLPRGSSADRRLGPQQITVAKKLVDTRNKLAEILKQMDLLVGHESTR